MCSGSEAGSYLRRIHVVYHSILGLRVMKKKEEDGPSQAACVLGLAVPSAARKTLPLDLLTKQKDRLR